MTSSATPLGSSFSITLAWRAPSRRGALLLAAIELFVAVPAIPSGIALVRDGMASTPAGSTTPCCPTTRSRACS